MAIAENGPGGHHRGRLGKFVYYTLDGKNVVREIGVSTKPFTDAQLNQQLITKIRSEFFRDINDFLSTSFSSIEGVKANDNGFNMAVKYNLKIIKGDFPNLRMAFDEIVLSKGPLKPAENWNITQTQAGIEYSWDTDPQMSWSDATDQVMLLAYFPQREKFYYTIFGNTRLSGRDLLELPQSLLGQHMETYMSFISADRKKVSNSIYTGSLNAEISVPLTLNS